MFGLDEFRPGQEEVIHLALSGRDALAIMPTGAGKSLCYQLPALLLPGMTIVISPLIALMKDQTDKLGVLGLDASQINSAQRARDNREALDAIGVEAPEFMLTTPERMAQPDFVETLKGTTIDLVVIDEAHCISEWGHDFRPAYLSLGRAIDALGSPPVLALTATATPEVIDDIRRQLNRPDLQVINTGIHRPNLVYEVRPVDGEVEKQRELVRLIQELDGIGIVYTATVKNVEAVTKLLGEMGIAVARYHGQLSARERHDTQERFMRGELKAIVATNAFGMGIDKPDIRFVVHYNFPGSLDAYYQESGRAGRDGDTARCVLLYQPLDKRTHFFFIGQKYPRFNQVIALYSTLTSLRAHDTGVDPKVLQGAVGVPRSKLVVLLALLSDMELVAEDTHGGIRLLRPDLGEEDLAEIARVYDVRKENDRAKLDRMITYAQTALCRWHHLLATFGEAPAWTECGLCDNCIRMRERPAPIAVA